MELEYDCLGFKLIVILMWDWFFLVKKFIYLVRCRYFLLLIIKLDGEEIFVGCEVFKGFSFKLSW